MMDIAKSVQEIRTMISTATPDGLKIGLVPTMGALHDGHLSLVRRSKAETDLTVVSIFVNPTQFGEGEDLDEYPRDMERDKNLLETEGVELLFLPEEKAIYPEGFDTWVVPGKPAAILEGEKRPSHFKGVCTVVLKLFEIVRPDKAFFGQKDAQQFVVLNSMVRDFNLPIEMIECEIIRESDRLAMSSRNSYLNPDERNAAIIFYKALQSAKNLVGSGEVDRNAIIQAMEKTVNMEPLARLDYAEIVTASSFTLADSFSEEMYICIAGYIGNTRLIDNIKIKV